VQIRSRSLIFSFLFAAAAASAQDNPVVSITGGQISGRLVPEGGATFRGIPYAAPPVGDLRWKEPAPVKPWTGVRDGGEFGRGCVQQISGWNSQEAQGNQEDCLYLNVWTPEWPVKSPKAVMLWLHGGGNTGGAASVDYFDGVSLARRGIVLVTINYRLGVFGFFAHPALTAESPHHASSNYGLLDQVAALKWVQANISKFGGDPKQVTVFGQSAGAVDTSYMIVTPLTKGLITRAIQESGPPIRDTDTLAEAEKAGVKFAASLKAPDGAAEQLKFLRAMDAQALQKAAVAARGGDAPTNNPVFDGYVFPKLAAVMYMDHMEAPIPIIVGNNAREQPAPRNMEELKKGVAEFFGPNAAKMEEFYGIAGDGKGKDDPFYGPAGIQFTADTRYRCGMVSEAIWHSSRNLPVYEYQFDHPVAGRPATQHSAELPFVFGNLLPGGFLGGPFTDADRKTSNDVQQYWTNFAKTGDPNGPGLAKWPKFDPSARAFLEFAKEGPVVHEGLRRDICQMYFDNLKRLRTE
jgi:para-nitrobenzyl esterase